MHTALVIVGSVAAAYVAVGILMFLTQRQLVYQPSKPLLSEQEMAAMGFERLSILAADGLRLGSWYRAPPGAGRPILVVFHGNAGTADARAGKYWPFVQAGFGLVLAEYRGYGGNPGRPAEPWLHRDADALLAELQEPGVVPAPIVLYGESLGSGVAVRSAGRLPVAALVIEGGFSRLSDVAQRLYPWLPVRPLLLDRFDNLSRIGAVNAPVLVLHGTRDEVVAPNLAQRLFDAANEPKALVMLPQAGHNDLYQYGASERILAFLANEAGLRSRITVPQSSGTRSG
jgi:fermentation-respiration switch protein FrsA (DUF1100 family)